MSKRSIYALSYCAVTGAFSRPCRDGAIGTRDKDGYLKIRHNGKMFMAHRLAWMFHYGEMPNQFIDHINGEKSDNRISNLRLASAKLNAQNIRKPMIDNKVGMLGVTYEKSRSKYRADIYVNGKANFLGRFITANEAHEVYLKASTI